MSARNLKVCLASVLVWGGTLVSLGASPAQAATASSVLHGFAAVSSSDVWATGYSLSGTGPYKTLAEHWNGSDWEIVSTPSPGAANDFLNQPAALASNDAWVVGSRDNSGNEGTAGSHTLIEHWNGASWQVVPSPSPGDTANVLRCHKETDERGGEEHHSILGQGNRATSPRSHGPCASWT